MGDFIDKKGYALIQIFSYIIPIIFCIVGILLLKKNKVVGTIFIILALIVFVFKLLTSLVL